MNVVLCYPIEPRHIEQIEAVAPGVRVQAATHDSIPADIFAADIFCGHAKGPPVPWADVVKAGRLQWIQSSAAGMDHCLTPAVIESDIVVTSASGLFADQVAEHTLALMTSLSRSMKVFFEAARRREFIRRATGDIHRSTVGIVGFGGNGRRIAEVLAPLKTRLLATDLFPHARPPHVEALWPAARLPQLLAESDYIVLCIPLNDDTRGMFDADVLSHCKRGAALINVARGPVVFESALVAALQSGRLSAAALDVTEVEPLPPESPLWEMPQVVITPHVGAQSQWRYDDVTDFFCGNLQRYLAGEPLENLVDKRLGFPVPEVYRTGWQ